jgi:hypothetical protein
VHSAPRLDPRLVKAIDAFDADGASIAETRRRVGELANKLGRPRPSYERVRQLVHLHRSEREERSLELLLALAFNTRPVNEILADLLAGERASDS